MGDQVVGDALIQIFCRVGETVMTISSIAWAIRTPGGIRAVASRCGRTRSWEKDTPAKRPRQCEFRCRNRAARGAMPCCERNYSRNVHFKARSMQDAGR